MPGRYSNDWLRWTATFEIDALVCQLYSLCYFFYFRKTKNFIGFPTKIHEIESTFLILRHTGIQRKIISKRYVCIETFVCTRKRLSSKFDLARSQMLICMKDRKREMNAWLTCDFSSWNSKSLFKLKWWSIIILIYICIFMFGERGFWYGSMLFSGGMSVCVTNMKN